MENDADEIYPRLWQGSAPQTPEGVKDDGFSVLVLCAREFQPKKKEFPQGLIVIHCPLEDVRTPPEGTFEDANRTATLLRDLYAQGHTILITCMAGLNRSGLVMAMTLHKVLGWSGASCIEVIRQKRLPLTRTWDPYSPRPLNNSAFCSNLLRLPAKNFPK